MRRLFVSLVIAGALAATWVGIPALSDIAAGRVSPSSVLNWPETEQERYRLAEVTRGDISTSVQAAGTLNALVVVDVGSQISGRVTELYADFNSPVERGQVIARIDPETYEARVAQAEAELEMARTDVTIGEAQIERARAEIESHGSRHQSAIAETDRALVALDRAERELERRRPLANGRIISPGEWERTENDVSAAEAELAAAKSMELAQSAAVRAAQADLATAEAQIANSRAQVRQREALLRQARIDLDRTYIRAPVTGTVVNRAVSGGQTLAASLQSPVLFTIAQDLSRMQVEASIVEADVSRFAVGQHVDFTVDAFPGRVFPGTVRQIRKAPQIVQNVVSYIVIIDAENPDEMMLPGMTANLRVVVAERAGALLVPNAALRFQPERDGDKRIALAGLTAEGKGRFGRVFVPGADGAPMPMHLELGLTDGRMTEIVSGDLRAGNRVILGASEDATEDVSSLLVRFRLW